MVKLRIERTWAGCLTEAAEKVGIGIRSDQSCSYAPPWDYQIGFEGTKPRWWFWPKKWFIPFGEVYLPKSPTPLIIMLLSDSTKAIELAEAFATYIEERGFTEKVDLVRRR